MHCSNEALFEGRYGLQERPSTGEHDGGGRRGMQEPRVGQEGSQAVGAVVGSQHREGLGSERPLRLHVEGPQGCIWLSLTQRTLTSPAEHNQRM